MARISYGSQVRKRTRLLLSALLAYGNDDVENCDRISPHIKLNWQTNRQLVIRTKIRYLMELITLANAQASSKKELLTKEHVKEGLRRLGDFLEILDDHRPSSQGSDIWHFTLRLWFPRREIAANLQRFDQEWEQRRSVKAAIESSSPEAGVEPSVLSAETPQTDKQQSQTDRRQDWGDALSVSTFYGRTHELEQLSSWLTAERCRLVMLLGMGGMGKTALAVELARQTQASFDCLIWRSLRNAPPIQSLLAELIAFFSNQQASNQQASNQQATELPDSVDNKLMLLGNYLKSTRCLIVLDNLESILSRESSTGSYRAEYEGYGQLLRWFADTDHQSCLLMTSREKPLGLGAKETKQGPVRSLQLSGLNTAAAQALLQEKECSISADEGQVLIQNYAGNPLALKIVATTIQDLFGGETELFLTQGTTVFGSIEDLLNQQFERLSPLEHQIMVWLALRREGSTLKDLQQDLHPPILIQDLLAALSALQRRSLIEKQLEKQATKQLAKQAVTFTQQSVVMEYVLGHLTTQVCEEIESGSLQSLNRYALTQAGAKDYIREAQVRLVLRPIVERLVGRLGTSLAVKARLDQLLEQLRTDVSRFPGSRFPGYGTGNILMLLHQLEIDLSGYDFSNLALWQVYFPEIRLPGVDLTGADLSRSVFTQTIGVMMSAAFSPDGQRLATGVGHDVVLWQIAEGKQLSVMTGHSSWVVSVAFSPESELIASGSHDCQVRLWNAETGQCVKTLSGHTSRVESVAFSPDGTQLASASNDQTIRVWDVEKASCSAVLKGHSDRVLSVCFGPDGQTLVSGSHDQTVRVWDLTTHTERQRLETAINWNLSMALSPDGNRLATGSDGKVVQIWDLLTGHCLLTLPNYTTQVWAVDFSPDGQLLATGSSDKTVRVWQVATGECLRTLQVHTHQVWLVAFSPVLSFNNDQTLVSISDDRTLKLWDVASGHCLRTLSAYSNRVEVVTFSPDGKTVASAGEDWRIRLWMRETGQCVSVLQGHKNLVSAIAYSPDGKQLISGSDDTTVKLWEVETGACVRTLWGHQGWVHAVAFHPDRQRLVSGSYDRTIKLWDARSGECLQTFEGHIHRVKTVALNSEGTVLASGSDDKTVKLWEVETGFCLQTLQGHDDWVVSVAFQPVATGKTSELLASAGGAVVKLWDVNTGECEQVLTGHQGRIRWIAWSPEGQRLATCGEDQTLRLWAITSGECLWTVDHPSSAVWAVAFSPEGEAIASASEDETVRVWQASSGECCQTLSVQRPYEGMNIAGAVGLTMAQRLTLKALGAVELDQQ